MTAAQKSVVVAVKLKSMNQVTAKAVAKYLPLIISILSSSSPLLVSEVQVTTLATERARTTPIFRTIKSPLTKEISSLFSAPGTKHGLLRP